MCSVWKKTHYCILSNFLFLYLFVYKRKKWQSLVNLFFPLYLTKKTRTFLKFLFEQFWSTGKSISRLFAQNQHMRIFSCVPFFLIPEAAFMFYHFGEYQELYTIADKISLQVPDLDTLVEKMNIAGYLIQKRSGMYQVKSYRSG